MDITTALALFKGTTETLKALRRVVEQTRSAQATEWLTELQNDFINIQQVVMDLVNEKSELQTKVQELEEKLKVKEELVVDHTYGVYWRQRDDGKEGPYCPQCWGLNQKLVLLNNLGTRGQEIVWICANHDQQFHILIPSSETPNAVNRPYPKSKPHNYRGI